MIKNSSTSIEKQQQARHHHARFCLPNFARGVGPRLLGCSFSSTNTKSSSSVVMPGSCPDPPSSSPPSSTSPPLPSDMQPLPSMSSSSSRHAARAETHRSSCSPPISTRMESSREYSFCTEEHDVGCSLHVRFLLTLFAWICLIWWWSIEIVQM